MDEQADQTSAIESLETALKSDFNQLRDQQKSRLEQLSSLMSTLESCTQTTTAESDALHTVADGALERLAAFKSDFGDPASKQRESETRVAELNTALENAEREKSALAEKAQNVESTQEVLGTVRAELASRNEAFETLQREFDQLRQAHDAEHQELSILAEKVGSIDSAQEALEGAQAELAEKNSSSESLQGELDGLRKEHEQQQTDLESARARAETAEEKLGSLESDASGQREETETLQARFATLEEEIQAKASALQEAQSTLETAQSERDSARGELEALKEAQGQAETTQEGLKTELISVQRESEALRVKYREGLSTDAALALRQQVTETAEEVKRLEAELAKSQGQTKKSFLAQQLTEAIQESEHIGEENAALKQELSLLREGTVQQQRDTTPSSSTHAAQTPDDDLIRIQESARTQSHGPKRVIGQILHDAGIISDEQLHEALELQKSNPQQHLGSILAELGFASEEAVAQARASQCGVEFIRFSENTVEPAAAALINERLAIQHSCIPIAISSDGMTLAIANPMDLLAIEDVERFTNKKVDVVVGTVQEIESAISQYYWEPE